MSSYVTIAPDGSRDVDVQSLFEDQLPMVRRIARMDDEKVKRAAILLDNADWSDYAECVRDMIGDLCSAQQRIAELEGERDRLAAWVEFVRYNSKDAAHLADENVAELEENHDAN